MAEYYIMNASSNRELLKDKSWLADNTLLVIKIPGKKRPILLFGSGKGYTSVGKEHSFIYDTGSGHRRPQYGQDKFKVLKIVEFNSKGEPNKSYKATGMGFYVMK